MKVPGFLVVAQFVPAGRQVLAYMQGVFVVFAESGIRSSMVVVFLVYRGSLLDITKPEVITGKISLSL